MTSEPRLLVGVDWATQAHQVCVLDPSGAILDERSVPATGDGLFGLVDRLRTSCPEDPAAIFVSIEVTHGPVVETLMDAGFTVFAINPKQLDRFRDRHTLAGAKDDRRDAYVLADSLRTDRHLFRELEPEHPLVVQLREWSRMTDDLGRDRVRVGNRIREQLRRYAPQFLELEEDVSREWLLDLWELVHVPSRAQRIHTGTIAKLLAKHRIRKVDAEKVRAVLCQRSVTVAPGTQESAIAHIDLAIQRMRVLNDQIKTCEKTLDDLTTRISEIPGAGEGQEGEQHDAQILRSLPGVGRIVLATLLAEAARALRERDYQTLRALGGCAPVTKASGKRRVATMRKACNPRLRNALYHWARVAAQIDTWSRTHYAKQRAAGKTHGRALRSLADRLLAVACSMLRHRTEYDPRLRAA